MPLAEVGIDKPKPDHSAPLGSVPGRGLNTRVASRAGLKDRSFEACTRCRTPPRLPFTTFRATLSPEGDPDGSGSAVLEIDTKTDFGTICYQIQVENVARPITGGAITVGESGETVGRLVIQDRGWDLEGCTAHLGIKNRDLKRIQKDPGSHFLHLYNDEHPCEAIGPSTPCPPGAVIVQLEGVS